LTLPAFGEEKEKIGIGLATDPESLSLKTFMDTEHKRAIDMAIGLKIDQGLYVHADYLFNWPGINLDYYTGVGLRVISESGESDVRTGFRFPIGVSIFFDPTPVEVFTELSLTSDILPKPRTDFSLGLGARYYFDNHDRKGKATFSRHRSIYRQFP
jgi:hypothetical protein